LGSSFWDSFLGTAFGDGFFGLAPTNSPFLSSPSSNQKKTKTSSAIETAQNGFDKKTSGFFQSPKTDVATCRPLRRIAFSLTFIEELAD
jgi:hypothetical protein